MCYIFFQTRDCLWEYSEADRVGEEDGHPQGESLKSCLCDVGKEKKRAVTKPCSSEASNAPSNTF